MKCPYCNETMRPGYIQGGHGVIFSEKQKIAFTYKNPWDDRDIKIAGIFSIASPAHYCDRCGCLIWKKNQGDNV